MKKKRTEEEQVAKFQKTMDHYVDDPLNYSYWGDSLNDAFEEEGRIKTIDSVVIPIDAWDCKAGIDLKEEMYPRMQERFLEKVPKRFKDMDTLFIKTGTFSNKDYFKVPKVEDIESIYQHIAKLIHMAFTYGAGFPTEIVVREFIHDKENAPTIYHGMPLRTEFRFFYDFESHKVLGAANYWHEDEMAFYVKTLKEDMERIKEQPDTEKRRGNLEYIQNEINAYNSVKDKIREEFDFYKHQLKESVEAALSKVDTIEGKWSIDIMKNGEDFYFIDAGLMSRSALVDQMEELL